MDNMAIKHMRDLYGLNPNIPHMALQFPRLPPMLTGPMFKIHENPVNKQFLDKASTLNQKLEGFQHMYQQYASGLLSMNSAIIPPGHPLHDKQNSVQILQSKNDKLTKENLDLKKRLQETSKHKSDSEIRNL